MRLVCAHHQNGWGIERRHKKPIQAHAWNAKKMNSCVATQSSKNNANFIACCPHAGKELIAALFRKHEPYQPKQFLSRLVHQETDRLSKEINKIDNNKMHCAKNPATLLSDDLVLFIYRFVLAFPKSPSSIDYLSEHFLRKSARSFFEIFFYKKPCAAPHRCLSMKAVQFAGNRAHATRAEQRLNACV